MEKPPNEEIEEVLRFAIEGRKRIKMQLMRIDPTYATVNFGYKQLQQGKTVLVRTSGGKRVPPVFRNKGS